MADQTARDALHAWMRSQTPEVLHAREGDVELWLSPSAPVPAVGGELPQLTPAEERRRSIDALLWSSGADPTPFYGEGE